MCALFDAAFFSDLMIQCIRAQAFFTTTYSFRFANMTVNVRRHIVVALLAAVGVLVIAGALASPPPKRRSYDVLVIDHASAPILSSSNAKGKGNSDGCLIFNPSVLLPSSTFNDTGLLVRECCGETCAGHGRRRRRADAGVHAERISFARCNLDTAVCEDAMQSFNLDPEADAEDPRAIYSPFDGFYYLFYYRSPAASGSDCEGDQCTVQLSRTKTPLNVSSWDRVATLPWHRNGCCHIRKKGQMSVCMWGEGPGPFPGLGISTTQDFSSGNFTQVPWKLSEDVSNASSPVSADSMWLLPLGPNREEIKLEAGTHMHELSTGDLITFYAAATPGWVAHGNYTVGWIILSGTDNTRIVQRSTSHLLVPTFDYETLCPGKAECKYKGERHNVIFLSSAVATGKGDDSFRLFFGAGDGNVGTAVVHVGIL